MDAADGTAFSEVWNWISSSASIGGFILGVFVFFGVRRLQAYYLFKARVPELITSLIDDASQLNAQLRDFEGSKERIDVTLSKCRANLQSIAPKLPKGPTRKTTTDLAKAIRNRTPVGRNSTKGMVWEIYVDLQACIQQVKNLEKDKQWEKP